MSHATPLQASKGSLLVIFLTVFVDLLGFGIVLPLLPIYAKQFISGEQGWQIGLLMASFSAMQFLFSPIWGRLSDQIGRRPVLMIGLAGSVVFYAMFGWATAQQSLVLLFVSRIGAGIAGATISTAQAYIADCTTAETRSRGMALIGMAFGLGFTLGPLLGYLAVSGTGEHPGPWPGYVAAALSAGALLLSIFILPESHPALRFGHGAAGSAAGSPKAGSPAAGSPAAGTTATGSAAAPPATAARPATPGHHSPWSWHALQQALSIPSVPSLLLTIFICVFSFASFETTISMLVSGRSKIVPEFAFDDRQVFLVFAYIGLVLALVQGGLVRRLAGKVPDTTLAGAGAIVELVGFGLMIAAIQQSSVTILLIALGIVTGGFAFVTPSLNGLLSRRTSADRQGGVLGIGQSISSLARILGAMLGPTLLGRQAYLPFIVALLLMVVGLALIGLQRRVGRDAVA